MIRIRDVMDELYAVGWWTPGLSRQWVVAVYPSVPASVAAAGGYARFDGGGRWRVYATRVVSADRTTRVVRTGWWPKALRPAADADRVEASPAAVELQQLAEGVVVGDVGRP